MRKATVNFLLAVIAQLPAEELAINQTGDSNDSMDKPVDKLAIRSIDGVLVPDSIDKLVDRLIDKLLSQALKVPFVHHAWSLRSPGPLQKASHQIPPPSPLAPYLHATFPKHAPNQPFQDRFTSIRPSAFFFGKKNDDEWFDTLRKGDPVQVYSKSTRRWLTAEVVTKRSETVQVTYTLEGDPCQKLLPRNTKDLRPPPGFVPARKKSASPARKKSSSLVRTPVLMRSKTEEIRNLKREFGITGQTIDNGKYLLCDKPQKSTSGRSVIYRAFRADRDGNPYGDKLAVKVSNDCELLSRENDVYNKVTFGLFPGRFVKKIQFMSEINAEPASASLTNKCALVIEGGRKDLQAILAERGGRGLEGRALRDAAVAAAECIQAMHSSGVVWTDLKASNFVVVGNEIGDRGSLPGVKGIDVESGERAKSNPIMYSATACPPEFARAFLDKQASNFVLEYSYDIFGYGLFLYELATGSTYGVNNPTGQMKMLAAEDFEADLRPIEDDKLRNLMQQCLQNDPRKRPNILQILLHPYFTTTAFR